MTRDKQRVYILYALLDNNELKILKQQYDNGT